MGEVLMVARQTPNLKDRVRFLAPMPNLGPLAQLVEPTAHNGLVVGSNPAGTTTYPKEVDKSQIWCYSKAIIYTKVN